MLISSVCGRTPGLYFILEFCSGVSPRLAWCWRSFCLLGFWSCVISSYNPLLNTWPESKFYTIVSQAVPNGPAHFHHPCLPSICTHSPIRSRPYLHGLECFPLPFILWLSFPSSIKTQLMCHILSTGSENIVRPSICGLSAHGTYLYLSIQ